MEDPLLHPVEDAPDESELGPLPIPPLGLETDPWYAFRDELAHSTRKALARVDKLQLLDSSVEILSEVSAVQKGVSSLKEGIVQVEKILAQVERKRSNFAQLSDQELSDRSTFLGKVKSHVRKMDNKIQSALAHAHRLRDQEIQRHQQSKRVSKSHVPTGGLEQDVELGSTSARLRQEQMVHEQDASLDEISSNLTRLQTLGVEMHQELESQNLLLDEINDEASGMGGKMEGALSRLDKYLHSSSRGKTLSISFLVLVLLVEIIIVSVI